MHALGREIDAHTFLWLPVPDLQSTYLPKVALCSPLLRHPTVSSRSPFIVHQTLGTTFLVIGVWHTQSYRVHLSASSTQACLLRALEVSATSPELRRTPTKLSTSSSPMAYRSLSPQR